VLEAVGGLHLPQPLDQAWPSFGVEVGVEVVANGNGLDGLQLEAGVAAVVVHNLLEDLRLPVIAPQLHRLAAAVRDGQVH